MSLKLTRRPRSPYWIMRGTIRGVRVEESTGTSDRGQAEEVAAKRAAELFAQSVYGRRATATFAEAALSYQEQGGSSRFLAPVIQHFKMTPLVAINQEALDRAARKLYPKASLATRNRQFYTPASAILHHAAKRGWCDRPLIQRPAQPRERIRWLTEVEAERLLVVAEDRLRPLYLFLLYTGARVGEALWLDWHDVDLARAHVTFEDTKNGEARGVPLHPRVVAALANLEHRQGEVFRARRGKPYARPIKKGDTSAGARIANGLQGACSRAGITNFHPHDFRHTWATWHYAANRDLGSLQRLGGWKSVRMVMRYAHVNVAELSHTIHALPGGYSGNDKLVKKASS